MAAGLNPEHKEGSVARTIEEQTAKLPSVIDLARNAHIRASPDGLR
jgi:hypothetical protein